ncbi:hypothetical protein [Spartinivicinus poritis]|uniref:Multidrug transporter n=1 Tax=Spartinivicinus poritis TaxID=2994640 RepID=A0ABT5UBJ8_9GAMM|nr:hypothetical protein [Spartinivicinus sp. A2-2]MDE1463560.1 hypothetical protein [Spartinivicinus sp. A2-2]
MQRLKSKLSGLLGTVLTAVLLAMPVTSQAEIQSIDADVKAERTIVGTKQDPSAYAMVGDALIARPLLFGMTVVGSVAYVVTLPFSLLGENASQAAETLVLQPARATFVRCLGCTVYD